MESANTRERTRRTSLIAPLTAALSALLLAACGGQSEAPSQPAQSGGGPAPAQTEPPAQPPAAAPAPLAGTRWQLVEFVSMDDAQGTTRPADPSQYTMTLAADGTVAMQLNCNRATGTWTATPGADGTTGTFGFGPLAMTRALCPPPSMDERIARDAEFIRGYMLRDGRLNLSLMADGGIYVWEPAAEEVGFQSTPDAEIESAILAAAPDYTRELVDAGGENSVTRYVYSRIDLNRDGRDEVFAYLLGPFFCGTGGCDLLLFSEGGDGLSLVNDFPTSRMPVIVTADSSNGWRDIWRYRSGGGAPPNYVAGRFDGMRYVDGEQIPGDDAPAGTRVLAGEYAVEKGIVLQPRG